MFVGLTLRDDNRWLSVGSLAQLKVKQKLKLSHQGINLALFWVESLQEPVCFVDRCSHQDVKLSDFGRVEGTSLVCLAHGARFQLPSGDAEQFPACDALKKLRVDVKGDDLYVSMEDLDRPS